jgi:hypothetical protein
MIDKSVLLPLALMEAFQLFTARVGEWWPPDRRHLKDANSQLFLLESGRFYERATDGTELDLGRVRVWESPHRLVLDFFVGTDAAHPTKVEIRFAAVPSGTQVTVHHEPTDLSADLWNQRAPIFERSWDAVLAALDGAAARS